MNGEFALIIWSQVKSQLIQYLWGEDISHDIVVFREVREVGACWVFEVSGGRPATCVLFVLALYIEGSTSQTSDCRTSSHCFSAHETRHLSICEGFAGYKSYKYKKHAMKMILSTGYAVCGNSRGVYSF